MINNIDAFDAFIVYDTYDDFSCVGVVFMQMFKTLDNALKFSFSIRDGMPKIIYHTDELGISDLDKLIIHCVNYYDVNLKI